MNGMGIGDKAYLSREKYEEIGRELETLKTEGRHAIAERLKAAKDLGDLSENSDYQETRDEQARLEARIAALEETLRRSEIIHRPGSTTTVKVGTKVKVKKDRKTEEYTIVGSNEADPSRGFISNESPIGHALLGKRAGDVATIATPKGEVKLHVVSIE